MIQLNITNPNTTFKYFKQTYAFVDSQNILHISGYYLNNYFSKQNQIDINNIPYNQIIVNSNTINITYINYDALTNNLSFTNTLPNFTTPNLITFELYTYQGIILSNTNLITAVNIIQNISNTLNSLSSVLTNISETCISITNLYNSITNLSSSLSQLLQSLNLQSSTIPPPIYLFYSGNVTTWSETYSLSRSQIMIISFTNSQTLFIPLYIVGHNIFKIYLTQNITSYSDGGSGSNLYLYPNNTTIAVPYVRMVSAYNNGSITSNVAASFSYAFKFGWALGTTEAIILNMAQYPKTIIIRDSELGTVQDPATHFSAQYWNDFTTLWQMFGTITLPQVSSGFIGIRRIV